MGIITLTSDMGLKDYYVAAVKGRIFSLYPDAKIVDVSHNVRPFDIAQASFVLKNVFRDFPDGTVHVIGVNPERKISVQNPSLSVVHLIVKFCGHYFIGADNGIFSLLIDNEADLEMFEITVGYDRSCPNFPMKDIFVEAACHLATGGSIAELGLPKEEFRQAVVFTPVVEGSIVKGTAIYIDVYGNVITNVTRDLFEEMRKGRDFVISFRSEDYGIDVISQFYSDVPEGEKIAMFDTNGYLMIAINHGVEGSGGGASSLFGLGITDSIRIEFKNAPTSLMDF